MASNLTDFLTFFFFFFPLGIQSKSEYRLDESQFRCVGSGVEYDLGSSRLHKLIITKT